MKRQNRYQGTLNVSKILHDGNDIIASGVFNVASGGQVVLNRALIKNVVLKDGARLNQKEIYTADTSFIPMAYRA